MGAIYCCDHNIKNEKIDNIIVDFDYTSIENLKKPLKSIFKLKINQQINQLKFAESIKVKKYKLKHRKRLLLRTNKNQIHLISYYLGNILFLLTSIIIEDKYNILSVDFLSKKNSSHICITIEDSNKFAKILILNVTKLQEKPPIEVNTKQKLVKNDDTDDMYNSNSNINSNQNNIVERMINSTENSQESSNDNNEEEEVLVLRKYESEFKSNYFKVLTRSYIQDIFPESILLVKYDHYYWDLKQIIEEKNLTNISEIKVNDYHIFLYSEKDNMIRCLKINKSHFIFKLVFEIKITIENAKLDNLLFPVMNENIIILDKLNFLNFNNEKVTSMKNFQNFFNFEGLYVITNLTKVINYITQLKLNNGNWLNMKKLKKENSIKEEENFKKPLFNNNSHVIMTFIITGECKGNVKSNKSNINEENRFLSVFVYNTSIDSVSEFEKSRSKIRILKSTPEITDLSYGPFDNGPIITGHNNGLAYIWSLIDISLICIINIFDCYPINSIINEPFGMTLFTNKETGEIQSMHIIDKKSEYFYHESQNGKLTRIQRNLSTI